jgi:predicted secreted protein
MNWFTGVLVYCMVWVVVLLTVLPFGIRPTETPEQGHEPGAPDRPRLLLKFLVTTLIAAVIWGVIYLIIDQGWISFRQMAAPGAG